jgi:hypothetical protein
MYIVENMSPLGGIATNEIEGKNKKREMRKRGKI